jgi:hypothetical protein
LIVTETRVGGARTKGITNSLLLDGAIHVDTVGYAGGLWLRWNSLAVDIIHLASTEPEIHALVKVSFSNLSWILSSIYASLRFLECYLLWKNLANVASIHSLPWLMMGDFNEVLLSDDKFVGRSVNFHHASNFRDYIDSCGIMDMGFSGPRFTWTNLRGVSDMIQERIDRCFCNLSLRLLFPEALVKHLVRIHYDYCLVLLTLDKPSELSS